MTAVMIEVMPCHKQLFRDKDGKLAVLFHTCSLTTSASTLFSEHSQIYLLVVLSVKEIAVYEMAS